MFLVLLRNAVWVRGSTSPNQQITFFSTGWGEVKDEGMNAWQKYITSSRNAGVTLDQGVLQAHLLYCISKCE